VTLRAIKPTIRHQYYPQTRIVSADGCTMAMATSDGTIVMVNLGRFAVSRTIRIPLHGDYTDADLELVGWPRPHRLIAYAQQDPAHFLAPSKLLVIDPSNGRVVRSVPFHGSVLTAQRLRNHYAVFLVSDTRDIGPARLVVATPTGRLRSLSLTRIRAGYLDSGEGDETSQGWTPGLAVSGSTAWVIGAHAPVARVNLRSMKVRYHHVPDLMRTHTPESSPFQPGSDGFLTTLDRTATWVGHHELLVTGSEEHPVPNSDKIQQLGRTAQLLDARTWRVVRTFTGFSHLQHFSGLLIGSPDVRHQNGNPRTLVAFRRNGHRLYALHGGPNQAWELFAGRLVQGQLDGSHAIELNPRTGTEIQDLGKPATWPFDVLVVAKNAYSDGGF
jgi:hypothetical protein